MMAQAATENDEIILDIHRLPVGNYLLSVRTDKGSFKKLFTKQ
jgi:hypothetical protein